MTLVTGHVPDCATGFPGQRRTRGTLVGEQPLILNSSCQPEWDSLQQHTASAQLTHRMACQAGFDPADVATSASTMCYSGPAQSAWWCARSAATHLPLAVTPHEPANVQVSSWVSGEHEMMHRGGECDLGMLKSWGASMRAATVMPHDAAFLGTGIGQGPAWGK